MSSSAVVAETASTSAADDHGIEGPGDGSVYGAFISRQLDDQRGLKTSLEGRATGVITSSSVLVTLLFGLAAITARTSHYRLPGSAHAPLLVALAAFVVAFALAVAVGIPFRLRGADADGLEKTRLEMWRDADWKARRRVAGSEIIIITSYKAANKIKARLLIGAGVSQLVALITLGVTVGIILSRG